MGNGGGGGRDWKDDMKPGEMYADTRTGESGVIGRGGGGSGSLTPAALFIHPGEYQTRDGSKAVVETKLAKGWWRGRIGDAVEMSWDSDGHYFGYQDDHPLDLIALWPQPVVEPEAIEVHEGDTLLVKCRVTRISGSGDIVAYFGNDPMIDRYIPRSAIHSIIERAPVDPQPGDSIIWTDDGETWKVLASEEGWLWIVDGYGVRNTVEINAVKSRTQFKLIKPSRK